MYRIVLGTRSYHNNYYNVTDYPSILYLPFTCTGEERSLLECQESTNTAALRSLLSCNSNELAGVKCSGSK